MISEIADAMRERLHLHASFKKVFDNPEFPDGQVVLRAIMREGFIFKPTHVPGDPQTSAMNEGMRRMALSILKHTHRDHGRMIQQVEQALRQNE